MVDLALVSNGLDRLSCVFAGQGQADPRQVSALPAKLAWSAGGAGQDRGPALFGAQEQAGAGPDLGRGIKTDVFNQLPDIDVLDPSGGVFDVPVQHIVAGAGVVLDNNQHYPITGWLEAHWARPAG